MPNRRWAQRLEYESKLDVIATSITSLFSRSRRKHCDRLSVITFGSAERQDFISHIDGGKDRVIRPVTYKVRRAESEFGFLLSAERLEPRLMEYEEPIAYVVDEDTDQGLSLEAYPWGQNNS